MTETVYRGFNVSHQRVALDVSLRDGVLSGYTELTIVPSSEYLKTVYLHFRHGTITSVSVSSANHPNTTTTYSMNDPFSSRLPMLNPDDVHAYPEAKRRAFSAISEGLEGEVAISVPEGWVESAVPLPQPPTPAPAPPSSPGTVSVAPPPPISQSIITSFLPISILINYTITSPSPGLIASSLPFTPTSLTSPLIYASPNGPDAARGWVPCVDSLWERCTWELDFVVRRELWIEEDDAQTTVGDDSVREPSEKGKEKEKQVDPSSQSDESEGESVIVVASGELVEHVCHPHNPKKSIFRYVQSIPTSVQHIAFAVGPFKMLSLPTSSGEGGDKTPIQAFYLPEHGEESTILNSTSFVRKAMEFYTAEYGSYPFTTFNLVFVPSPIETASNFATLAFLDVDLIYPQEVIDQGYETRHVIAHSLASQWSGINMIPKTWSDTWLINGISLYITSIFLKKLLGNNEYRYRLKIDVERCVGFDQGNQYPICTPGALEPPDASILPFINLKSPLVLQMLDIRLGKTGTSLGLSRVIPKIFLSAITSDLSNNALSTGNFLRICRKVSGVDMRTFAEEWIYGSGVPRFTITAVFNKKKMLIEMTVRQETPAYDQSKEDPLQMAMKKPAKMFQGQMTIRIHEADGTPYEHVLDIREGFKTYDVPFNTKYKRVRRNTKRYAARKAAAKDAAAGDADAAEAMGMLDLGFDLDLWEAEEERANWKVADWSEEDEVLMMGAPYEWIRVDADFEWIGSLFFDQQDFFWANQLSRDRDVVAQYDAIQMLRRNNPRPPTPVAITALTKTVLVTNYYFRIRMEAANSLCFAGIGNHHDYLGFFHLLKIYQSRWCFPPDVDTANPFEFKFIPKPNDFSNFAEYFVQKAVITAISHCIDNQNSNASWPVVRRLLVDLLQYNDNSLNAYSDGAYIATIISCLGFNLVAASLREGLSDISSTDKATNAEILQVSLEEVDRYMAMDKLVPSYHNVITLAGLDWHLHTTLVNLIPNDVRFFLSYTREGNYIPVRMAAFDCLLLSTAPGSNKEITNYIFSVVANDESLAIRRHLARGICESLIIALSIGQIRGSIVAPVSQVIEGDGSTVVVQPQAPLNEVEVMLKALKKEIGRSASMRDGIMKVLGQADVDLEVRWAMIQLADMLVKPAEEVAPKLVITLPPTPAVETAPELATPKIKLFTSAATEPKFDFPVLQDGATAFGEGIPRPTALKITLPRLPPPPPPPQQHKKKKKTKDALVIKVKAQSAGMSAQDLIVCRSILRKLEHNPSALYFRAPVDPLRDGAPDYLTVVKEPMDLSTVKAKLEDGQYATRFDFEADVRLIFSNARLYNAAQSPIVKMVEKLEAYLNKQWNSVNNTLDRTNGSSKPSEVVDVDTLAMPPPPLPFHVSSGQNQPPAPRPIIKLKTKLSFTTGSDSPASAAVVDHNGPPSHIPLPPSQPPQPAAPTPTEKIKFKMPTLKFTSTAVTLSASPTPPPQPQPQSQSSHQNSPQPAPAMEKVTSKSSSKASSAEDDLLLLEDELLTKDLAGSSGPSTSKAAAKKEVDLELEALLAPSQPSAQTPVQTSSAAPSSDQGSQVQSQQQQFTASIPTPLPAVPPRPKFKIKLSSGTMNTNISTSPSPVPEMPPPAAVTHKSSHHKQSIRANTDPIIPKRAKVVIKNLLQHPYGALFAQPVDPIRDGCPTYFDEIENPMDLRTMGERVDANYYNTWGDFARDMLLMFSNCRLFNPATTTVYQWADELETVFRTQEWPSAISKDLRPEEKKELITAVNKLIKWDGSLWFREDVDPVQMGIPQYLEIIKQPRSLASIKRSINADPSYNLESFDQDMDLIVHNACLFNGPDSEVGNLSKALLRFWIKLRDDTLGGNRAKRKDNGSAPGGGGKKIKITF